MLIIFFLLGLIIGSFLNVVVYRIRTAETILGRSHCQKCKKTIRWYDNIPVLSFVLLKFHCRDCGEKISWQYPLVELFTGIIFALISWKFFILTSTDTWAVTAYYLLLSSSLIVILVYDFLYLEIPSELLWTSIFASILFGLYFDFISFGFSSLSSEIVNILDMKIYSGVLAAFLSFVFFFCLSFLSRERLMGMGDAYLIILLGLILGFPEIFLALFVAFLFGAVYGTIMIVFKKKKMKSQVPFAPFLIFGTFVSFLFYSPLVSWYFSLVLF